MPPRGSQEPSGSSAHQDDPFIDSAASHSVSENFPNSWSSDESPAPESSAPSSTTSSPMILYQPPTILSLLRGAAINLFLPFMNGLMLGFGELFAHEVAYRLGWSNTRVLPTWRRAHSVGPGVEVEEVPSKRRTWAAGL